MLGLILAAKIIQPRIKVKISKEDNSNFDHSTDTLTIGYDFEGNPEFMAHLENVHKCDFAREYADRFWTILHEIGHYETDGEMDDEEVDDFAYATLVNFVDNSYANQLYFNLPREYAATEWAIEWILLNPRKAKVLNWLVKH